MTRDQTKFDEARNGAPSPTGEIRHGVRHLARDVMMLTELQANLLQVEANEWVRKVALPALVFKTSAAVAALASLPILLLSLAYWLVEAAALSLPLALLAAGGVGMLISLLFGLLAWQRIRSNRGAFARFKFEFTRNVTWLKQILSRPTEVADPFDYHPYVPDATDSNTPHATPTRPR